MTDQSKTISLYVEFQKKLINENPKLKEKFIKILLNSPEDLVQECKNNMSRIIQIVPPDFRDNLKSSSDNNPERFCRDIVNEFKKVFLN